MTDRERILYANPLPEFLEKSGHILKKNGSATMTLCPFHEDRNPSMSVTDDVWHCHACGIGGSVIDYVMRRDGISAGDAMRLLGGKDDFSTLTTASPTKRPLAANTTQQNGNAREVAAYDYRDESGKTLYQVVRYEPKTFRQRAIKDGKPVYSMDGVRMVLYRLPEVAKSDFVWIVEGEKDADALAERKLCGTCNAGGAKKWLPQYNESVRGKDIIICGHNDHPGQKPGGKVKKETANFVRTARVIKVPSEFKDVSDFLATIPDKTDAAMRLVALAEAADELIRGQVVPVYSMEEMERDYRESVRVSLTSALDLSAWIPAFRGKVRPMVPGEVLAVLCDTGVGKTMIAQNIAMNTRLPTLMFSMELPRSLAFERFAGMAANKSGQHVYSQYYMKESVDWRGEGKANHIFVCDRAKLKTDDIERIIGIAGLKMGVRPALVIVDYMQLLKGKGERYDRISDAAEELKVIAKTTNSVIVVTSQIARKKDAKSNEVFLHDAKESGSIENSAGLIIGAWREPSGPDELPVIVLKLLKNTKGISSGLKVQCRIRESLLINEEMIIQ